MVLQPALRDQIKEIISQTAGGQIVALCQKLMALITEAGYVRQQVLTPEQVMVHPANRDGLGLSITDVHELVEDIVETGFSDSKCQGIAVDVGIRHADTIAFNRKLAEASHGMLPEPDERTARYASLAGSHTAAGMRCVLSGSLHPGKDSKLVVDGCFNINLVEKADQAYAKACRAGTLWQVISNDVIHEFPQVADLLLAGQNTNVFKRESEYQILRRMVTWIGQQAQVSWNSVKSNIMKTKPDCAQACPYMFQFLTKFMSHDDLQKTDERVMQTPYAYKALGTDVWQSIAKDAKSSGEVLLMLRHCAVRMGYCSGHHLAGADVRKMLQDVTKSGKIQAGIEELRELVETNLSKEQQVKCMEIQAQFEDKMVLVAMDKRPKADSSFTMVPEAHMQVFVDAIRDETTVIITKKFEAYRPDVTPSPLPSASTDKDQQVSSHG